MDNKVYQNCYTFYKGAGYQPGFLRAVMVDIGKCFKTKCGLRLAIDEPRPDPVKSGLPGKVAAVRTQQIPLQCGWGKKHPRISLRSDQKQVGENAKGSRVTFRSCGACWTLN
jgi:hypothetical protein